MWNPAYLPTSLWLPPETLRIQNLSFFSFLPHCPSCPIMTATTCRICMETEFPTSFIYNGFPAVTGFTSMLDETHILFFSVSEGIDYQLLLLWQEPTNTSGLQWLAMYFIWKRSFTKLHNQALNWGLESTNLNLLSALHSRLENHVHFNCTMEEFQIEILISSSSPVPYTKAV